MYGILFRVEANPGKFQELVDFMTWDAEVCQDEEPGTLRFEFYQDPENENALYVYEAYQDLESFAAFLRALQSLSILKDQPPVVDCMILSAARCPLPSAASIA